MAVTYVLLLLGAALTSCSPIHSVSPVLDEAHRSIRMPLNLFEPEVGRNPLFSSVIRSLNNSCQVDMMLMNATLDVYMRIFSLLLHPHSAAPPSPLLEQLLSDSHIRDELKKLKQHMGTLKTNLSRLQPKEDLLSKINNIKVDDPLVQRKALAEFLEVFHAASGLLHSRDCGRTH